MADNYNSLYREALYTTLLRDFHNATQNDWHETLTIPDEKRLQLRSHLIIEEAREFEKAAKERDIVEMADALVDLLYVTFGSIGELGLGGVIADLFEEVHRSNMTKLCRTTDEALETIRWYEEGKDVDKCKASYERQPNGWYRVYRVSDGKTLKRKTYSPANIAGILSTYQRYGKR